MWPDGLEPATDDGVRATLAPADIALHADRPEGSARNVFQGTVLEVAIAGSRARVRLGTAPPLVAEVTTGSVERMGLAPGRRGLGILQGGRDPSHGPTGRTRYPVDREDRDRAFGARFPRARRRGRQARKNPVTRFLGEMPGLIFMSLLLAILIKTFLIQAFYIPSGSMENTLKINDRVLVSKVPYYLHDPQRGDIIVFADPDPGKQPQRSLVGGAVHWLFQGIGFQKPDSEDFIKRVIGTPGDTVEGKNGKVYVNGVAIDEPYVKGTTSDFEKVKVPDDMYFVMGDNRQQSQDSRFGLGVSPPPRRPEIGFIPRDDIIGKAWVVVWPKADWAGL